MRVLSAGGNAIDAAVVATAVLAVVEPQSTGIGGDCFALISRRGTTPIVGYNGSGRSPRVMPRRGIGSPQLGRIEETSVHSVTVPGMVEALARLLADHGTLSLAAALEPAIDHADRGFPVHQKVAAEWAGAEAKLRLTPGARRILLPLGRPPAPGEVVRFARLAETLGRIAKDGAEEFYAGQTARAIVAFLREQGGHHTLADFSTHRGAYVEAVSARYGDADVWQIPPNGQGVTTLLMLGILESLGFGSVAPDEALYHHWLAEAARLAFDERNRSIGDPEHGAVRVDRFIDKAYAAQLAASIDRPAGRRPGPASAGARGDTAYVSVVDSERNAVSMISSLFENFGCGLTDPETGTVFHCRGTGFVLSENHPNSLGPGKRPLHTIIPGMVSRDRRIIASFGVTGGPFQPIGQAKIISAMLDRGLDIQAAIDEPRSFYRDGSLYLEPALAGLTGELTALGHQVLPAESAVGGAHGVLIDWETGVLTGGSDARKDGCALAI